MRGFLQHLSSSFLETLDLKKIIGISPFQANRLNRRDWFGKKVFFNDIISESAHNFGPAAHADMHCRMRVVEIRGLRLLDFWRVSGKMDGKPERRGSDADYHDG